MENEQALGNGITPPADQTSSRDSDLDCIMLEISATDDPNLRQILEEYLSSWLQHTSGAPA